MNEEDIDTEDLDKIDSEVENKLIIKQSIRKISS
jgi:hypothetical protein